MIWNKEPAAFLGLVGAAIALGVGFGLPVTSAQVGLIMAFVSAGLAFVTRSQVIPTDKANSQIMTGVRMDSDSTLAQVIAKNEKDTK